MLLGVVIHFGLVNSKLGIRLIVKDQDFHVLRRAREDRLIRVTRLSNRFQTATSTSRTLFGGRVSEKTIRNRLRSNNFRAM